MLPKVCVITKLLSNLPKNHWILSTHSSTSKNVSWPHFSWPTLYSAISKNMLSRAKRAYKCYAWAERQLSYLNPPADAIYSLASGLLSLYVALC